jgi:hypothetical protein
VRLDDLLQRAGVSRDEIRGLVLQGELPLADALVNRVVSEQLMKRQIPIAAVRVEAQAGDQASVLVVPKLKLIPPIRLQLRIEEQPALPARPVVGLRWSMPGAGPLALLAGPALAFFKSLPAGIRLDGDRLAVDLRELLAANGLAELLDHVRNAQIHTRTGGFVVGFEIAL